MIVDGIDGLIGNTPLIKLNRLSEESGATIFAKCEFLNPTSSVKDRIALNMINRAIERGEIDKNSTIIEPTSGNTGIALAAICASKGLKLILTMPEFMSVERRKLLSLLGAEIVLTPADKAMKGSIDRAYRLAKELGGFVLQQFENSDNPQSHRETTAVEILDDLGENIDYFVAGVGTGGTITGISEVLKERIPTLKSIAVEPSNSAILSGEKRGSHNIQGIGGGLIPKVLNLSVYDDIIKVDDGRAFEMAKRIAKEEGLMIGISSGANLQASFEVALKEENRGKTILTILCDTAERYMSTELFE